MDMDSDTDKDRYMDTETDANTDADEDTDTDTDTDKNKETDDWSRIFWSEMKRIFFLSELKRIEANILCYRFANRLENWANKTLIRFDSLDSE